MRKIPFILISLLVAISCRKDPAIPFCELHPNDCVDIREVKEYFYFKIGSYWVYEEENSGLLDSTYVIETYSDTNTYYFDTRLHSDYDGYNYHYWPKGGATQDSGMVEKSKRSTSVTKSKTKPGDFISESHCFLFYPVVGLWTYTDGGAPYGYDNLLTITNIYDSLAINGLTFPNVVCLHEEHTASEDKQPTYHYYSKGIGLVKKELIDSNQAWNLIRYHIEN